MGFLEQQFYGNSIKSWLSALVVLVGLLVVLRVIRMVVTNRVNDFSKRTETSIDDLIAELFSSTRLFFLLAVSIYAAIRMVLLPSQLETIIQGAVIILVMFQIGLWGNCLLAYLVSHYVRQENTEDTSGNASQVALTFFGKILLWALVFLLILHQTMD